MKVLSICASKKHEGGALGRPSASRSILTIAEEGLRRHDVALTRLDFVDISLPPFEGLTLADYEDAELKTVSRKVSQHSRLILSIPAYWGGPSGVGKNFIDLMGGAKYVDDAVSALSQKVIALIVIGAAEGDARRASEQIEYALMRQGAAVARSRLCLDDPGHLDPRSIAIAALAFAKSLARELRHD